MKHPFRFRIVLATLFTVIVLVVTFVVKDGTVHADTPGDYQDVKSISIDMRGLANSRKRSAYESMISDLRNAVGHDYRSDTQITQSDTHGLVQLTVRFSGHRFEDRSIRLWFTAQNLYLRGVQIEDSSIIQFSDFDLRSTLDQRFRGAYTARQLHFTSNYGDIARVGNRHLRSVEVDYQTINIALNTLADARTGLTGSNEQDVARSLQLMIQWTSEAARFHDIFNTMAPAMEDVHYRRPGIDHGQEDEELNWSALSAFGRDITENPNTPPRFISIHIGVVSSFLQVARYLAILASRPVQGSQL